MSADLTPAQAARLEAIEAAPWAEEAAVERVARALARSDYERVGRGADPWNHLSEPSRAEYRSLAVAAIDVMRGATDDGATCWRWPTCDDVIGEQTCTRPDCPPAKATDDGVDGR